MNHDTRHQAPLGVAGFALLLAGSLFWSGCATQRPYPGPVHGLGFDGTVQSIDLPNRNLVVLPSKPGGPVVFTWDRNTKFWKNGIPIHPEEVEPGKSVRIHYHLASDSQGSDYVAHHVCIEVPYASQH
jgi:hypothetical protein